MNNLHLKPASEKTLFDIKHEFGTKLTELRVEIARLKTRNDILLKENTELKAKYASMSVLNAKRAELAAAKARNHLSPEQEAVRLKLGLTTEAYLSALNH